MSRDGTGLYIIPEHNTNINLLKPTGYVNNQQV